MRIAIPTAAGKLCAHFGHCEEFALIDVDVNKKEIIREERVGAPPHQPGLLPRWLLERGAEVVVAGGMGMRAQQLFAEKDIRVIVGAPADDPASVVNDLLHDRLRTGENLCDH